MAGAYKAVIWFLLLTVFLKLYYTWLLLQTERNYTWLLFTSHVKVSSNVSDKQLFSYQFKWICTIWPRVLIIMIIQWLLSDIYFICVPRNIIVSLVTSLRSGINGTTWAANKLYALQKSCDCPIFQIDGLLNSLRYGASLARLRLARAPLL